MGTAGLAGGAPEGAFPRPRRPESSHKSPSSGGLPAPHPRTQLGQAQMRGPTVPQVPVEGGSRDEDGAAPWGLTSALPAAAGAGPGGARARPAHPPASELSWAPSEPALRPPVSKLLNLRAAHSLRGQRPTRRIGPPGRPGPALLSTVPHSGDPPPALCPRRGSPLRLGSAAGAPSRERG